MADHAISAPVGAINTHAPTDNAPESNRASCPDAAILAAFKRFQEGSTLLATLDPAERREPGEDMTPGEKRAWDIIDAAEVAIQSNVATTPAGIAAQLWIAMNHSNSVSGDAETEALVVKADLRAFDDPEIEKAQNWDIKLMLVALRGLERMGA